jgi:hypothetical protein
VNVSSQSGQARIAVSFDLAFGENAAADLFILIATITENVLGHRSAPSRNDNRDISADEQLLRAEPARIDRF